MPLSTFVAPTDPWTISPLCCAFPIGEIEVQAVDDSPSKQFSTRIMMSPKEESADVLASRRVVDNKKAVSSMRNIIDESSPSQPSRYGYFSTVRNSPGGRSLADSFDSTDEIEANSNEAKLIKRVVEKRTGGMHYNMGSGWEPNDPAKTFEPSSSLERQDSMSDTNSVNSMDVFLVIDESQEMEYLGVLDQHLIHTTPEETDYACIDNLEMGDFHPKKHQANLDDIIDHLCAAPCGECLPDSPFVRVYPDGSLKSVLRRSRFSPAQDSASIKKTSKRKVRFQYVDIREFKMTLGNHPSATSGPPVMLDSEPYRPRKVMTLEKYESTRPPRRKRRQLKLTLQQRHNILVNERGLKFDEVKEAWQEALLIRKQRKETLERGLALMKWDEVWESTCRKLSRLVDGTIA